MPLARVFTHYPERATALCEQLQQQGYQIEVRSPDQTQLAPADLEVEFEICDRADVLQRAATLADELQADVAVAPGVLQPVAQSATEPVEASLPGPAEILPAEGAGEASLPEAVPAQERDPEREFEAAFSPIHAQAEPEREAAAQAEMPAEEQLPYLIETPAAEFEALPPVAMMEEPDTMRAESVEIPIHESAAVEQAPKPADPVPYLAQLRPFGPRSSHGQAEETPAREPLPDSRSKAAESKAALQGIGRSAASIFSTAISGARSISASAAESFRERLQEYRKRAQVRSAEARAERVARMLDLEQRKAEAHQRATELEAAREAASARLIELIRQRDPGLSEEERKATPSPMPPPIQTPVDSLRHASIAGMQAKPRRPMTPQLRAVLTGAAAVSILFVIGIVLGEFYPRAPLASTANHAANGVTVQGAGGATVKMGEPVQPTQAKAPQTAIPAAATQQSEATKPSPRVSQARHVAAQQGGETTIGDDVVIRHFSRPVPTQKPRQSGQQAGLKHFSDM